VLSLVIRWAGLLRICREDDGYTLQTTIFISSISHPINAGPIIEVMSCISLDFVWWRR